MRGDRAITLLMSMLATASVHAAALPALPAAGQQANSRSPFLAVTAGDFANACKNEKGGCADMIGEVLLNEILYSNTAHICLPDANYPDRIPTWLLAHPETSQMAVQDGIYLAITTLYRCSQPDRN